MELNEGVAVVADLDASQVGALLAGREVESVNVCFSAIPDSSGARNAVAMKMWHGWMNNAAE